MLDRRLCRWISTVVGISGRQRPQGAWGWRRLAEAPVSVPSAAAGPPGRCFSRIKLLIARLAVILEGIVTTLDAERRVNIAPMGPIVDAAMHRFIFRPYQTSTTYANLARTGEGVFHVVDDVLLLAQAAVGQIEPLPNLVRAEAVDGMILADACRWYAFRVASIDASHPRTEIISDVIAHDAIRDFFGFNRAKHAVVEAAILATRVHLLPAEEIERDLSRHAVLVQKTGGPREHKAFEFLSNYIHKSQSP